MRFVIQSSIFVVIVAILLHAALAIPLPGPPEPGYERLPDPPSKPPSKPSFLKDAVKQQYHKFQAAWSEKQAKSFRKTDSDVRNDAVESIFGPNSGINDAAAAAAAKRAQGHEDNQQEHLASKKKYKDKRKGNPA